MTSYQAQTVFADQEIAPRIIRIIDEAKQLVVLVSPFLGLDRWETMQRALERATSRKGVEVRMFLRSNQNDIPEKDVKWLLDSKVKVFFVEWLHAKIYMNEQTVLLSSMNLTQTSTSNSMEIAYLVRDPDSVRQVRNYVSTIIEGSAIQLKPEQLTAVPVITPASRPLRTAQQGFCIRCGRNLYFEPTKPLCDDCYDSWARYENEDYPENVCHSCGQPATVTKARPLCAPCYARLR